MQNLKLTGAPHGHHQFFEPFFDSDVTGIQIFGFHLPANLPDFLLQLYYLLRPAHDIIIIFNFLCHIRHH